MCCKTKTKVRVHRTPQWVAQAAEATRVRHPPRNTAVTWTVVTVFHSASKRIPCFANYNKVLRLPFGYTARAKSASVCPRSSRGNARVNASKSAVCFARRAAWMHGGLPHDGASFNFHWVKYRTRREMQKHRNRRHPSVCPAIDAAKGRGVVFENGSTCAKRGIPGGGVTPACNCCVIASVSVRPLLALNHSQHRRSMKQVETGCRVTAECRVTYCA